MWEPQREESTMAELNRSCWRDRGSPAAVRGLIISGGPRPGDRGGRLPAGKVTRKRNLKEKNLGNLEQNAAPVNMGENVATLGQKGTTQTTVGLRPTVHKRT